MRVLAIESSCDETAASVVEKNGLEIKVLSNIVSSSVELHAKTGGIIPENAAREQVKYIIPVIVEALITARRAGGTGGRAPDARADERSETSTGGKDNPGQDPRSKWQEANEILKNYIDAIAVTYGPGLIGSLLIGVETVKTLSLSFNKPLIPVNHLLAHIYANFISTSPSLTRPERSRRVTNHHFPFIGLIVSGGHTDLLYFKSHNDYKWLGGTRDDAAGEALDKIGRMLNLSYPAGPEMEKCANRVTKPDIKFKSPLINSDDFDFSFSGLKTEAMRYINEKGQVNMNESDSKVVIERKNSKNGMNKRLSHSEDGAMKQVQNIPSECHFQTYDEPFINSVCFATQKAVIDVLVKKTLRAAEEYKCQTILLGGGVSANKTLIEKMNHESSRQRRASPKKAGIMNQGIKIYAPQKEYCTDNAAMIGAYALVNGKEKKWKEIKTNPELYFL